MLVVEESRVILMWHLASSSGAAAINSDMFLKPVGHRHADGAGAGVGDGVGASVGAGVGDDGVGAGAGIGDGVGAGA